MTAWTERMMAREQKKQGRLGAGGPTSNYACHPKTKGQRDVRVVDYFPDKQQFVRDGTFWMREGEIPKPEYFRLRQKVREVRKGLRNGNVAS